MSVGAIAAIVVGAVLLVVLFALLGRRTLDRRNENRRVEAGEIRREAQIGAARADRQAAEADMRGAQARREQAIAAEQAAQAEKQRRFARERHAEADDVDPDVDRGERDDWEAKHERDVAEHYDQVNREG